MIQLKKGKLYKHTVDDRLEYNFILDIRGKEIDIIDISEKAIDFITTDKDFFIEFPLKRTTYKDKREAVKRMFRVKNINRID